MSVTLVLLHFTTIIFFLCLTGAADKDTDEEEGATGTQADETEDDEQGKHILPLVSHQLLV